jgi:hypothetical protein
MTELLFIVPIVLVAFISYYFGKNQEKAEWKKLIKEVIEELKRKEDETL